jgi:hypothetical protein
MDAMCAKLGGGGCSGEAFRKGLRLKHTRSREVGAQQMVIFSLGKYEEVGR